jgi:AraC-like DNA-binding protein
VAADARKRIEATAAYMERHLNEPVTRETLAALADMNPEHYSRLFRKYKGTSPIDYITELRMTRAKALMRQGDLSILAVARQVGFTDPYYFSRRFKQAVGVSPSLYRLRPQKRIVALDYYEYFRMLGIEPVGVNGCKVSGHFADWFETASDVFGQGRNLDIERLRRLEPDLIVTAEEELEPVLSAIGTTVVLQMYKDPVYEQLATIAGLTDKANEAAQWIASYEDRSSLLRHMLASANVGNTAAVLRIRGTMLQIYGMMNMGYPLYRSLLFDPPEKIKLQSLCNRHFHSCVIVPEELPFYEADHLFVVLQPDSSTQTYWEQIRAMEIWRKYPAVRCGNVYEVDVRRWLAYDPVSIAGQMEEAASLVLKGKL